MKKILLCSILACFCLTFTACGDDDDLDITDCYPPIYTYAKELNLALSGQSDCVKKAETLSTYTKEHEADLKLAGEDYKKIVDADNWNSVGKVFCNALSAKLKMRAYEQLKAVNDQFSVCEKDIKDLGTEAQQTWNSAVKGLSSIDGWDAALNAAADAAIEEATKTPAE